MSIRTSVQRMTGYTPGEQPVGVGILKLNTNENPYPPSPAVADALAALKPERLRMYPDPMCNRLRSHLAEMHACHVSQVFVGNGSDETLALCTRAFVENNGSIGYFEPSYSLYPVLADIRDVERRPVPLAADFEWTLPGADAGSLFFLTNPNAPTGRFYPRDRVRAFCERFPGIIVIDEAYVDFADHHCMDFAIEFENVLVARTLSKSYSLAGLRVGYIVGSTPLIDALYKIKDSYNLDMLSQQLALAALSDAAYMRANVEKIKTTRRRLSDALISRGWLVHPSQSNFIWTRPTGLTAEELFLTLKRQNIFIRYFPGQRTGDHVRITIGTDAEIDRLLTAIRELT